MYTLDKNKQLYIKSKLAQHDSLVKRSHKYSFEKDAEFSVETNVHIYMV